MPQYLSPGVYVEEVDSGPRPIQGVSTSVTGAVGVTVRGPTQGKPVLVTNFADFVRQFGGFMREPEPGIKANWSDPESEGGFWWLFPHAVKGFFDNGGQQMYVKRVISKDAAASSAVLGQGMHSEVMKDAAKGSRVLKLRHLIGIQVGSELKIFNAKSNKAITTPGGSDRFTVESYDATENSVQFGRDDSFSDAVLASRGDFVKIHAVQQIDSLQFNARAKGQWGDDLQVRVRPVVGAALSLMFSESDDPTPVTTQIQSIIQPLLLSDYSGTDTTIAADPGLAAVVKAVIGPSGTLQLRGSSAEGLPPRVREFTFTINGGTGAMSVIPPNPDDEVQKVTIIGDLTSGTFDVTFTKPDGTPATATVNFDDDLTEIQSEIDEKLPPAGSVKATGSLKDLTLTFGGGFAGKYQPPVKVDIAKLLGATSARVEEPTKGDNNAFLKGSLIRGDETTPLWTIVVADEGLADGDRVAILGRSYNLTSVEPPTDKKLRVIVGDPAGQGWQPGTVVRKVRRANKDTVSTKIRAAGADRLYVGALIELDNEQEKEVFVVQKIDGSTITLGGATQEKYHENQLLRLIEASVSIRYKPENGPVEASEELSPLRLTADEHPNAIVNAVNRRSSLVLANPLDTAVTTFSSFPIARDPQDGWQALNNGSDAEGKLNVDDFVGADGGSGNRTGIQALEDVDDISIVAVPGIWAPVVRSAAITHCEAMRYRVAILDPPPGLTIEEIGRYRSPIDSKYAALYYPWLSVRDPLASANVPAPPSGHVAGIYARVDTERGVHKAPANEVIRNIAGLDQDITKREQDLLNPEGINALRFFSGRGFRVWGARTLSSDTNFRYINVRRIFNFIERSIDEGTQFVVFEPNDDTLWARVRQTVGNFLNTQWRAGVLEGKVAAEAYFVACDRGVTMTQDDIENGRLICEVGIAPVFPAEFVIFRIQKFTAESKLS